MKGLLSAVGCLVVLATAAIAAQENELPAPRRERSGVAPEAAPRVRNEAAYARRETTQEAIHRRAALKAAQRRERLAINKAVGYSPLRPTASPVPFMGSPISHPIVVRYTPFLVTYYPSR